MHSTLTMPILKEHFCPSFNGVSQKSFTDHRLRNPPPPSPPVTVSMTGISQDSWQNLLSIIGMLPPSPLLHPRYYQYDQYLIRDLSTQKSFIDHRNHNPPQSPPLPPPPPGIIISMTRVSWDRSDQHSLDCTKYLLSGHRAPVNVFKIRGVKTRPYRMASGQGVLWHCADRWLWK